MLFSFVVLNLINFKLIYLLVILILLFIVTFYFKQYLIIILLFFPLLFISVYFWEKHLQINQILIKDIFYVTNETDKTYIFQDSQFRQYLLLKTSTSNTFEIFKKYTLEIEIQKIENNLEYFINKGIFYQINKIKIENQDWTWKGMFWSWEYFNYFEFKNLVMPLLFGYFNSKYNTLTSEFNFLGIIHLIVVSGFHFNIVYLIFTKILWKIKWKNEIAFILIIFYFLLCKITPATIKSFLMIGLTIIFKRLKKEFYCKNFYFLIFASLITLIINPWWVYSIGYWMSFLISFFIYLNKYQLKNWKIKLKLLIKIWIVSMFLTLFFNLKIYVFSLFLSILFTPIIEICIILLLFGFYIKPFVIILEKILNTLLTFFSSWNFNIIFIIENNSLNLIIKSLVLFVITLLFSIKFTKENKIYYN